MTFGWNGRYYWLLPVFVLGLGCQHKKDLYATKYLARKNEPSCTIWGHHVECTWSLDIEVNDGALLIPEDLKQRGWDSLSDIILAGDYPSCVIDVGDLFCDDNIEYKFTGKVVDIVPAVTECGVAPVFYIEKCSRSGKRK